MRFQFLRVGARVLECLPEPPKRSGRESQRPQSREAKAEANTYDEKWDVDYAADWHRLVSL
jgi:hypothetical protein